MNQYVTGAIIKKLREKNHLTQLELANKLNVSDKTISKWESEQCTPDLDKVILMSEYFDVTTDYILKGIEPVAGDGHVTVGDVLDKKILTEANGKRAKHILRYVLYGAAAVLAIDILSFILYVILHGFPM